MGEVRVGIFAKQDISIGTELAYDYNFEWYGGAKVRCLCGAISCSGFLGAKSRGFQVISICLHHFQSTISYIFMLKDVLNILNTAKSLCFLDPSARFLLFLTCSIALGSLIFSPHLLTFLFNQLLSSLS